MKITIHVRLLLTALLDADGETYSYDLARKLGMLPGSAYAVLRRFESTGWVTSRPETNPPPGRPPRRYFQLTDAGHIAAQRHG